MQCHHQLMRVFDCVDLTDLMNRFIETFMDTRSLIRALMEAGRRSQKACVVRSVGTVNPQS